MKKMTVKKTTKKVTLKKKPTKKMTLTKKVACK
jgi:hypothetical protein